MSRKKLEEMTARVQELEAGIRVHREEFCDDPLQEEWDLWQLINCHEEDQKDYTRLRHILGLE